GARSPQSATGGAGVGFEGRQFLGVGNVGCDPQGARVPAPDQLGVHEPSIGCVDVAQQPPVPVAFASFLLQSDGVVAEQTLQLLGRLRGVAVVGVDLGGVDPDEPDLLLRAADPHANGVAVNDLDDGDSVA